MTSRTRDWRRAKARLHGDHKRKPTYRGFQDKAWKLLYRRANKLHRARQLGKPWPYREWETLMNEARPIRVLFVCSRNQWRSPTGEAVFRRVHGVEARSAGTTRAARHTITMDDIRWADVILVMEQKHKSRLQAEFRDAVRYMPLHVLDIPDDYAFMDEELVALLQAKATPLIMPDDGS